MLSRSALAALFLSLATSLLVTSAHADSCEDECDSDRPECSAAARCPDSGVECDEFDEECGAAAEANGLERRCSESLNVYCDPSEADPTADDGGCAIRRPQRSTSSGLALGTFAAAGIATAIRAARRRAR